VKRNKTAEVYNIHLTGTPSGRHKYEWHAMKAQSGRSIALLILNFGTKWEVVWSMPSLIHFTPGTDLVHIWS